MATHAAMASQMCTAMDAAKPKGGWASLGTLLHSLSNTASAGGRPELYLLLDVSSSPLLITIIIIIMVGHRLCSDLHAFGAID